MSAEEGFIHHLRRALNHLYEPDVLRASPLAPLLLPPQQARQPMALSRALTEAIESLKPALGTPPEAPAWRIYELLLYRYVHCATQADLAQQLAISVRQLRREQAQALAVLAEHLKRRHGLGDADLSALGDTAPQPGGEAKLGALSLEFQWLQESAPAEPADLGQELDAVRSVLAPLLEQYGVRLDASVGSLPPVAVPPAALRQALLSLLTGAVHRASPGRVSLQTGRRGWSLSLHLRAERLPDPAAAARSGAGDEEASLRDAEALLQLSGGTLTVNDTAERLTLDAELPLVDVVPVLVVDDNRDALQLLGRYAAGTRYRLIPCHDPLQAIELAERERPALVVIDVMMAGLDGWQLLQRLRQGGAGSCPVIVCTVLAQQEVATALGASDFLRKPVSRQAFLEALDRQWAMLAPEPAPGPALQPGGPGPTGPRAG